MDSALERETSMARSIQDRFFDLYTSSIWIGPGKGGYFGSIESLKGDLYD